MSFMWSDDLGTGIAAIDSQHRELIARVNELVDVCSGQTEREAVGRFLVYLHEYITYHFAAEEREMSRRGYPGLAAHRSEHEEFTRRVNDLSRSFLEHGANIQVVLMTMRSAEEWLVNHIKKTDRAMAAFLKNQAG
jgi:hemerythrin